MWQSKEFHSLSLTLLVSRSLCLSHPLIEKYRSLKTKLKTKVQTPLRKQPKTQKHNIKLIYEQNNKTKEPKNNQAK